MSLVAEIDPPPGSTVRFVSDLHLGDPRSGAPSPTEFLRLMHGVDLLALCGDTAETHPSCVYRARAEDLRGELRELCARQGIRMIELAGNHDPDIELQMVRLWQGKVVAMHGHALLRSVAPWSREFSGCEETVRHLLEQVPSSAPTDERLELARRISMLLGEEKAHAAALPTAYPPFLREIHHCFWPPLRPLRIVQAWLSCARLAREWCQRREPDAGLFIFGHFHRGLIRRYRNLTLVNTGAWFSHATPYVADVRDARLVRYASLNDLRSPH